MSDPNSIDVDSSSSSPQYIAMSSSTHQDEDDHHDHVGVPSASSSTEHTYGAVSGSNSPRQRTSGDDVQAGGGTSSASSSSSAVNPRSADDEEYEDGTDGGDARLKEKDARSSSHSQSHSDGQMDEISLTLSSGPSVLIAFINFHSGGKTGESLAAELVKELGEDRVFDLKGDKGPTRGLLLYKNTPNLRVIVGGGDGTVNWVLTCMRQQGMTDVPTGCIPLGTGNDASRAFGWNFKYAGLKKIRENIQRMRMNPRDTFVRYDRWHALVHYDRPPPAEFLEELPSSILPIQSEADIPEFYRHPQSVALPPVPTSVATLAQANTMNGDGAVDRTSSQSSSSSSSSSSSAGPGSVFGLEFNNYLSFGVDAKIQGEFHDRRESCRECFCCRPCNMAWMGLYGFLNFCCCQSRSLDVSIEVRDSAGRWVGVPVPSDLRSLVLLNTPTYAGGRFLWGKTPQPGGPRVKTKRYECEQPQQQKLDDGLFEIVGVTSIMHLGMIMIGASRGVRLAQVSEARITFGAPCYAQVDGEPYRDAPSTYHIRPLRPATMMTRPDRFVTTLKEEGGCC